MNKMILLFVCIIYGTVQSNAQPQKKLLEGTIQQYPIILELDIADDGECSARYFYEKQRKDIELQGKRDTKGVISVVTQNWDTKTSDVIQEKFELRLKNGIYTGTWSNRKKTLPVQLNELNREGIKNPFDQYDFIQQLKKNDPYGYLRTSKLEFIKDSTKEFNVCTLDWYHEKYSKTVLFRITKGYEAPVMKRINDRLTETHLAESTSALECFSVYGGGAYQQEVQHFFASNDILSVNVFSAYECGGAHPDFGSQALNFDTHTGQQIALDEVLWFGKSKPLKENSDGWSDYRDKIFAPKIVSLLKQYHPEQMQPPKNEGEDCDYTDPEIWNFPNWYFTSKGLYVGPIFARAARSCDEPEWSVIPYPAVKQYVVPGSKIILPQ